MGYRECALEKLKATGHRVNEREALWQAMSDAFEAGGADAVTSHLTVEMANIEREFDDALGKLEGML